MKRFAATILFAFLVFAGLSIGVYAQTATPRPLPPEFLKRREAGSSFQLGKFYLRKRNPATFPLAIEHFTNAAKIYAELGDQANVACALLGVGAVYGELGEGAIAAIRYTEAMTILRTFGGRDINESALSKLGFLYDELVDKRFLSKYDDLKIQPPDRGFDQNGDRIDTRFSRGLERYYVQFFNQPFTVYYEERGDTILDDSRFALSGRPPEPISFYKDALAIWKQNGIESIETATQIDLMDSLAERNPRLAVFYGKQAVNQYQETRNLLRSTKPYDPRVYFNRLTDKYRFLADLLISLGRLTDADEVLQMLKDEEYADFVKRDAKEIELLRRKVRLTAKERQLIDRYLLIAKRASEIGEQVRVLDEKKISGKNLAPSEEKEFRNLSSQLADANAAFKLFLEKELVSEIGTDNAKSLVADRELQTKIREWGDHVAALTTVITENRYRVVLTTPTLQIDGKTEINAGVLNKKIAAFRKVLQDPNVDARPLGKELYDILIKPIEKDLLASKIKTLVWSLDGTLRYIPFAALSPDGKTYMAERFQNVVMTPKGRDRITRQDSQWRVLGMGVSDGQTVNFSTENISFDALPATKKELFSIVRDERNQGETGVILGRRFIDSEFTMENFAASLKQRSASEQRHFSVVHLASHFRLGSDWTNSFLLLGDGKFITLEQINRSPDIDLKGIELATLSACNTAILTSANGVEVDSLAESIQSRGGKAVLATLWSVYDESTAGLMLEFYTAKVNNTKLTKADSLQTAQLKMIRNERFAHPYYWSSFVLIGNWR